MVAWTANNPGRTRDVTGCGMNVAVDQVARTAGIDEVAQVRRIAPAQMAVVIGQAVRVRSVVGHDHGRAIGRARDGLVEEGAVASVQGK